MLVPAAECLALPDRAMQFCASGVGCTRGLEVLMESGTALAAFQYRSVNELAQETFEAS